MSFLNANRISSDVQEVLDLLDLWELQGLTSTFLEQEISLRSLYFLNENEIRELVPKLGQRTIFMHFLNNWRQEQEIGKIQEPSPKHHNSDSKKILTNTADSTSLPNTFESKPLWGAQSQDDYMLQSMKKRSLEDVEVPPIAKISKVESIQVVNSELTNSQTKRRPRSVYYNDSDYVEDSIDIGDTTDEEESVSKKSSQPIKVPAFFKSPIVFKEYNGEKLIVSELLQEDTDGRKVLDFYKRNGFFKSSIRHTMINILIRAVLERKITQYRTALSNMSAQILQLFPSEKTNATKFYKTRYPIYSKYIRYKKYLIQEGILKA